MKNHSLLHCVMALCIGMLLHASTAQAQQFACEDIVNGQTKSLTVGGVCRKITNNAGGTICAIVETAAAWNDYITRSIPGVTIAACGSAACAARTVNWGSCTQTYAGGASGSTGALIDSTGPATGTFNYSCSDGTFSNTGSNCSGGGSSGGGCFAGNTTVLMADGSTKPIKDVVKGDNVMSFDVAGQWGPLTPKPVSGVITFKDKPVTRINGSLLVTPEHKFPRGDGNVIKAGDFKLGDIFITAEGYPVKITKLEPNFATEDTVYNIEVEGNHSYVADGVRTHNMVFTRKGLLETQGQARLFKMCIDCDLNPY